MAPSTCSPWEEAFIITEGPSTPAAPQPSSNPPTKSLGRERPSAPGPARPICEAAQDARARNSPAASNLEAQCRATGGQETYYRLQLKQGGKYLDAVNCSDQVAVNAGSTYAAGACQLWRFVPAGDGWNRLQLKQGGKYLDAVNCSDQVALNAGSTYAAGACQLWRFVPAGDGWNRLQLKQGGKYLDASYCSDQVALNAGSTYAAGACQLWRLTSEIR
ncbi:RICIN domain-containing protein [Archangium lansingense]|uniref:RICIN domain-containing protein n=1 Tax=Archangium lansingense TaxID=2995310 RepID=A0ABT3ZZ64_9BACT|nr:RICIN domain-containing protein [Archangium lansinium]MCY1074702.1 RICIN domain-containing protein [Archangium lansinium]